MLDNYEKIQTGIDDILHYAGGYYFYFIVLINVLYVLLFFGLLSINYVYINYLSVFVQLFTGLFLLFRFHPFRKHEFKKSDSIIISHCAIFLLTNLIFVEGIKKYVNNNVPQIDLKFKGYLY